MCEINRSKYVRRDNSLSNEDRKEILRQKYIEHRGPISKDEFTGFMMKSEFQEFLNAINLKVNVAS